MSHSNEPSSSGSDEPIKLIFTWEFGDYTSAIDRLFQQPRGIFRSYLLELGLNILRMSLSGYKINVKSNDNEVLLLPQMSGGQFLQKLGRTEAIANGRQFVKELQKFLSDNFGDNCKGDPNAILTMNSVTTRFEPNGTVEFKPPSTIIRPGARYETLKILANLFEEPANSPEESAYFAYDLARFTVHKVGLSKIGNEKQIVAITPDGMMYFPLENQSPTAPAWLTQREKIRQQLRDKIIPSNDTNSEDHHLPEQGEETTRIVDQFTSNILKRRPDAPGPTG